MNNLYLKKVNPYQSTVYKAEGFCIGLEIQIDNDKYYNSKNLNKNLNLKINNIKYNYGELLFSKK